MAEKLTPQQQMAVDSRGGKLLVSAAAGSGKTKVLVDRVMKFIMDPVDPANIDEFLLITFTEAAAAELRAKIAAKLSEHIAADPTNRYLQRQMQRLYLTKISTVHSFCADTLREYAYRLDLPGDFRIGDENECDQLRLTAMEAALNEAYEHIHELPDFQAFIDTQGAGRNDEKVTDIIRSVYTSATCHVDPDGWLQACVDNAELSGITDLSMTKWGKALIEDLHKCLDLQIEAMTRCAEAVDAMGTQEKAAGIMWSNVALLKDFRSLNTWDAIVRNMKLEFGTLSFSKKTYDPAILDPVKAVRKDCKDVLKGKLVRFTGMSSELLKELQDCASAVRGLVGIVRSYDEKYRQLKRSKHILDYDDLEQNMLQLLLGKCRNTPTAAAKEIEARYREIMVDEFQDTNAIQDAIFAVLTDKRNNLFMVGDVKQSIYQFRLADPGIFLKKYDTFVPYEVAEPGQGRKVLLSQNFRSGTGVIDAVNDVFACCMSHNIGGLVYGPEEKLRERDNIIPINEPEVELHCIIPTADTYEEEAAYIAERIVALTDDEHYVRTRDPETKEEVLKRIDLDDIVILLRSTKNIAIYYQEALEARGIPCNCSSSTNLLLCREVEVLHSLLMVISNPRQDIPLLSVLASPVFGFTADDLAYIRCAKRKITLYDAMLCCDSPKCKDFLAVIDALRDTAMTASLPELMETIFRLTRIDTIYSATKDGDVCRENIMAFYHYVVNYSTLAGRDLDSLLYHLRMTGEKGIPKESKAASGCVRIMTVHKSKGLEFPVVFIGALSKLFSKRSYEKAVQCHKELGLGMSCVDTRNRAVYPAHSKHAVVARIMSDSLSEELRILYVAMTRAKDRLIMTYTDKHLETHLRELAQRSMYSPDELLASTVNCIGGWVLQAALKRTEAGELFALGEYSGVSSVSKTPWLIRVHRSVVTEEEELAECVSGSSGIPLPYDSIKEVLDYRYEHMAATSAPSKQTATQRKGRIIDREIGEDAPERKPFARYWRDAASKPGISVGKDYGNAVHNIMRYIRYSECATAEGVQHEIDRLLAENYISSEDAAMVSAETIAAFFATEVGRKFLKAEQVLREFKFSLLDDGNAYGDGLDGEQILLQGVVDCALVESDGITVIDFKTDRVSSENFDELVRHYGPQVETYAYALERVFELPVKKKALYFFRMNQFVWL